jgi:hypothetical protein
MMASFAVPCAILAYSKLQRTGDESLEDSDASSPYTCNFEIASKFRTDMLAHAETE